MKQYYILYSICIAIICIGCKSDSATGPLSEKEYFNDYESDRQKWGLIDKLGNVVIENIYDDIHDVTNEEWIAANKRGKWGYITIKNRVQIPFQFKAAKPFKGDYAWVQNFENSWTAIDKNGIPIISTQSQEFTNISKGYYGIKINEDWQIRTSKDTIPVVDGLDRVNPFINGTAIVRQNGFMGLFSDQGEWVLEPRYDRIKRTFNVDHILVWQGKNVLIYNIKTDKTSRDYAEIIAVDQDRYAVKQEGLKWILIDAQEQTISELPYSTVFSGGQSYILTLEDNKFGAIDKNGQVISEPEYPLIQKFQDGFAVIMRSKDNYNYLSTQGTLLLPFDLPIAFDFASGFARVALPEGISLLNAQGSLQRNVIYKDLKDFKNGYARFQN